MKQIKTEKYIYDLIENDDECFSEEEFLEKYTDYFYDYDYIIGDYSYNKLRLKGFCDKNNSKFNKINDINTKNDYLNNLCAYKCKYFVLKKSKSA